MSAESVGPSSDRGALAVDGTTSPERVAEAVRRLEQATGVVLVDDVLALRAAGHELVCEVIDRTGDVHRCEEELKVLVENAARRLAHSRLAGRLPLRPQRWVVVVADGAATRVVWPRA